MSAFPVNVVEFTRALEGWMGRASVLAIAQEKKKKKKKKEKKDVRESENDSLAVFGRASLSMHCG